MDGVPRRFTGAYRVRFDEAGDDGHLTASGFLRFAQDLAWVHSETAGFDRTWYLARGLQWLVRCIELEVGQPVTYGSTLEVTTEVTGWRRVWARRSTTFRVADRPKDAALAGRAAIDWVLIDAAGRPARVPDEIVAYFSNGAPFEPGRVEVDQPPPDALRYDLSVRPADLDPMAHVNNATYLDYLDEALAALGEATALHSLPRTYRAEYIRAAQAGDRITLRCWPDEGGWAYRLTEDSDAELLRARLNVRS